MGCGVSVGAVVGTGGCMCEPDFFVFVLVPVTTSIVVW